MPPVPASQEQCSTETVDGRVQSRRIDLVIRPQASPTDPRWLLSGNVAA